MLRRADVWDYADYDKQTLFTTWTLTHNKTTRCCNVLPAFTTTVQCDWSCQQLRLQHSKDSAVAGSQYSVVTDMHEAVWKDVLSITSHELDTRQCHRLVPAIVLVVFILEGDLLVGDFLYASVTDSYSVCIACQILQRAFGTADRRFGIYHPRL